MRGSSFAEMSRRRMGLFLLLLFALTDWAADLAAIEPVSPAILISLKVFHCPQLGHFPIHFDDSCPQLEHTYAILSFAITLYFPTKVRIIFGVTKFIYTFVP
jgi:hypothetical protein